MPSRRHFLHLAGGAAIACTGACSSVASPAPIGDVDAGNVKNLAVGTLRAVGSVSACIGRDANGVYAMTLTCTHQGCNIATEGSISTSGIHCGCHGSRFDLNGAVLQGPASDPLVHFAVTIDSAGELTIHGGSIVDAATRLAV